MTTGVSGYFDLDGSKSFAARIHYTETYDIASNKSSVQISKIEVKSAWYSGVTYYLNGAISVENSVAVSMNSTSGTHSVTISATDTFAAVNGTLGTVSNIAHNDDGSKSVIISVAVKGYAPAGGDSSGWSISGSKSIILATIPRKSTISASNGTLGTAQTLTISKKASSFTSAIKYRYGNGGDVIASKTSATSVSWTPPVSMASANPNGQSVPVELICETFDGITSLGTSSTSISCQIPKSQAKPEVSFVMSDTKNYNGKFGGYVQNRSVLKVVVTANGKYGATIKSGYVKLDDRSLDWKNPVFDLPKSGDRTVTASVTDSRGFNAAVSATLPVLPYSDPQITSIKAYRCDKDGNVNSNGTYMRVIFSARISPLDNKNDATYTLQYRKKGATSWNSSSTTASGYAPTDISTIVAAETGSSYEVRISAKDYFTPSYSAIRTVPSSYALAHLDKDRNRIGIGKVAERDNMLDIGLGIHMNDHSIEDIRNLYIRAQDNGDETGDIVFSRPANYEYEARLDVVHNFFRLYRMDKSGNPRTLFQFQMDDPQFWVKGSLRLDQPLAISNGGTGATTASAALDNLGIKDMGLYSVFHAIGTDFCATYGNVSVVAYANKRAHFRINGHMLGQNANQVKPLISKSNLNTILSTAVGKTVSLSKLITADFVCYDAGTGAMLQHLNGYGASCSMDSSGIYFGRYHTSSGSYGNWATSMFYREGRGVQFYLDMVVSVTES